MGCIEIKTGRLRWRYPPDLGYITEYNGVGAMAADGARLYFAGPEVGARDLKTGTLLWKAASRRAPIMEAPAPIGRLALFVGKDGWLHAVNAADGKPRWKFRSPEGKLYLSGPTVYGGPIFLHTGKALIALDASGKQLWTWRTPAGDVQNPTRIDVFNDGVLLHEWGNFAYYAMAKPQATLGGNGKPEKSKIENQNW
jgi:outer membrane protein assembly factor BamB